MQNLKPGTSAIAEVGEFQGEFQNLLSNFSRNFYFKIICDDLVREICTATA